MKWQKVCGHLTIWPVKNMGFVPREDFSQYYHYIIQPQEHLWGQGLGSSLSHRCSLVLRSGLSAGTGVSRHQTHQAVSFWISLCAQGDTLAKSLKNSLRTLSLLYQTVLLALCTVPVSSFLLASPKLKINLSDCQIVTHDSSLQRTCFHCSRVQWWHALHHFSWCWALWMPWSYILVCIYSVRGIHLMKLQAHSICGNVAVVTL